MNISLDNTQSMSLARLHCTELSLFSGEKNVALEYIDANRVEFRYVYDLHWN